MILALYVPFLISLLSKMNSSKITTLVFIFMLLVSIVEPKVTIDVPPVTVPKNCPIDSLKLGACVDLLGGLVRIELGDPVVNQCCPVLEGLVGLEAAACLCTTLKLKLLNLNIFVPLALQLLATCGKTPPAGYTCSP